MDVLKHQPTFAAWDQADLEHLASFMPVKKVPFNTVIIEQDCETDALYFIKSGEVRVVRKMRPTQVVDIDFKWIWISFLEVSRYSGTASIFIEKDLQKIGTL